MNLFNAQATLVFLYIIFLYFITFYPTGEGGVERDLIEAGKLFTELADQGHPFAQVKGH